MSASQRCQKKRFYTAIRFKNVEIVRQMLDDGFDPDTVLYGTYAGLHLALANCFDSRDFEICQLLLGSGASLEVRDRDGKTPLVKASSGGNSRIVQLLLERGVNVNAADNYGKTSLFHATAMECEDVIELLLRYRARIDVGDCHGDRPIHSAARSKRSGSLRLLLAAGANLSLSNSKNETVMDLAIQNGNLENVQLLIAAGAPLTGNRLFSGRISWQILQPILRSLSPCDGYFNSLYAILLHFPDDLTVRHTLSHLHSFHDEIARLVPNLKLPTVPSLAHLSRRAVRHSLGRVADSGIQGIPKFEITDAQREYLLLKKDFIP